MNVNFRIDPCLIMTVGFILIASSLWLPWAEISVAGTPGITVNGSGFVAGSDGLSVLVGEIGYSFAPAILMTAGLFALLPVFARKFLEDSEVVSAGAAVAVGLVSIVLVALMASGFSDAPAGTDIDAGMGLYLGILAALIVVLGGALEIIPVLREAGTPACGTDDCVAPARVQEAASEPVTEEPPEQPAPGAVEIIGDRTVRERPKRP